MKERLAVQDIEKNFINKERPSEKFLVLIGMRRVGKTTILKQLSKKYDNSIYINCVDSDEFDIAKALDKKPNLFLLDEFTHIERYEKIAEEIYETIDFNTKVIITGSSPIHLSRLAKGKIGGGRTKIIKIPPILFIEYLYFTNKIASYKDLDNVSNEWFLDYLLLKDLKEDLDITMTDEYIDDIYYENKSSNKHSYLGTSKVYIDKESLLAVRSVFAYKLSSMISNDNLKQLKIGDNEKSHLVGQKSLRYIDVSKDILKDEYVQFKGIDFKKRVHILFYLLETGLAVMVINKSVKNNLNEDFILEELSSASRYSEVEDIVDNISIQLICPFYYMVYGKEIFKKLNYDINYLKSGMITGLLYEVAAVGSLSTKFISSIVCFNKLIDKGEVDIFINHLDLLLELTVSDKDNKRISLQNYNPDDEMIRVLSSKTKTMSDDGIYRIPYAKLLCMIDNKNIFDLNKRRYIPKEK